MSEPPENTQPGEQPPSWQQPGQPQQPQWGQQPPPGYGEPPPPGYGQQPPPGYGQWGQQAPPGPGQWGQQQPAGYGQPPPGYGQPPFGFAAAAKPGIIPLRPLGLGEILDGAFTTMRRYPKATLGLSAAVATVAAAIQFVLALTLNNSTSSSDVDPLAIFTIVVAVLLSGLPALILSGMLTVVVSEAVLGKPVDLGAVWNRVRTRIGALIGGPMLVGLIVVGVVLVILVPSLLIGAATSAAIGVLGVLAAVCAGVYVGVLLSLSAPALILEGQKVTNSLRRSRALVEGSWWRVFGILFLASLISQIVGGIVSVPFGAAAGVSMEFSSDYAASESVGSLLLQGLGSIVSTTVSAPIAAGATALLYIDRRMRREGLDVALARAAATGPGAPPAPPPSSGW